MLLELKTPLSLIFLNVSFAFI